MLTITLVYGIVNSRVVANDFMIVFFQQSIPIFVCYGVIPCLSFNLIEKKSLQEIGIKKSKYLWIDLLNIFVVLSFGAYLLAEGVFGEEARIWVIHYLFVAISEEILVRGIILFELKAMLKKRWLAILISAVIFSLVFHSTDGTWINMLYRIPFGLITGILYEKTDSLTTSVSFHWIYDVLLSV